MKTKIKQTIAMILTLAIMLCALSACGTKPENAKPGNATTGNANPGKAIIGKWYNDDGKCLDVRSDGSYKLEDSYGTGTWKYLDDNETIEFIDFYGDTDETKIEKDDMGDYIELSSYGIFRRQTEDISENEMSSIKINKAGNFSDGVAWITYNDETGTEQLALINTKGEIIYKEVNHSAILPSEMHGVGFIKDEDENYKLISKEGNIIANSQDGTFESILACGDGLALVYKFSGPKDSKHLYGVIDSNGQFIMDYIDLGVKPWYDKADYRGCGIFAIKLSDVNWALVNCNTGSHIYIGKIGVNLPEFVNNSAYYTPAYYILKTPFDSFLQATQMSYCRLDTDFNISTISKFNYSSNGMLIDFNDGCVYIINPKTNDKYTLDYNRKQFVSLYYVDSLGLLNIQASDNNKYFTLLDTEGKEQFEPIKHTETVTISEHTGIVTFSDGKIIYMDDDKYMIADTKGKVLAENLDYKLINEFNDDIAVAVTTSDEYCFINSKGEKILQNIHE